MKYGDTRTSKASPIKWLMYFLSQYSPGENCKDEYVHLDQGGKLYNNPEIQNLFTSKGYKITPTGTEASFQNGSVKRAGANLAVKFWPYAFYHAMRLSNAFPETGKNKSPIQLANPDGKPEDLSQLPTFGC